MEPKLNAVSCMRCITVKLFEFENVELDFFFLDLFIGFWYVLTYIARHTHTYNIPVIL